MPARASGGSGGIASRTARDAGPDGAGARLAVGQPGGLPRASARRPRRWSTPASAATSTRRSRWSITRSAASRWVASSTRTCIPTTAAATRRCSGAAASRPGFPSPSMAAVERWDEDALSYRLTDQPCPRFVADRALVPGASIVLGEAHWQIHAAPGHDMEPRAADAEELPRETGKLRRARVPPLREPAPAIAANEREDRQRGQGHEQRQHARRAAGNRPGPRR